MGLSRRSFALGTAALAVAAPAIVRAQGLTKVKITQPSESLSYMPIYVGRAKQLLQGGRHRRRARRHPRRRPGRAGADGEGGRVRRHAAASPLHALSAEPEAARRVRHPRPLRHQHGDLEGGGGRAQRVGELAVREEAGGAQGADLRRLDAGLAHLQYGALLRPARRPQAAGRRQGGRHRGRPGGARGDEEQDRQRLDVSLADRRRGRASGLCRLADQQHARPGPRPQGVPARGDLCAARNTSARIPISASA